MAGGSPHILRARAERLPPERRTDWKREPAQYIEPGERPMIPTEAEVMLAIDLEALSSPW